MILFPYYSYLEQSFWWENMFWLELWKREERVAITLIPGKGTEAPELGLNGSKAEKRLQLEPA